MNDDTDALIRRALHDLNDLGNAERLAILVSPGGVPELLWIEDAGDGAWAAFDGQRWSIKAGKAAAMRAAHRVAKGLRDEARALASIPADQLPARVYEGFSDDFRKERVSAIYGWAIKSGNSGQTAAMLRQAQANPELIARMADFDTDPLAYHVQNGTIRFGEPRPGVWAYRFDEGHDPADRFMRMADVDYDRDAACAEWEARLPILQPDAGQRAMQQRLYGSTLTGLIDDQAFYVQQGKGGDGKSMTNIIMENLHGDYCLRASPKTFLEGPQKSGSDHQSDIVRLSGDIRMVVCDEPKRGSVWDGERIKQVTGSKVTARGAYARDEETFVPRFKLIVECNPLPRAPSDDDGFRRRFKLFVWPVQLHKTPGLKADPPAIVERRLTAEKSGILNWMIAGALDFLNHGRTIPVTPTMVEALGNYWEASSPLGEWLDSWCDMTNRDHRENASALWEAFKKWCEDQGLESPQPKTQTAFGRALSERHIMSVKGGKGVKYRRGIRLRSLHEVEQRDAERAADDAAAIADFSQQDAEAAAEEARSRWRPGEGDDALG